MKKTGSAPRASIPQKLITLLTTEFPNVPAVPDLIAEFLQQQTYSRTFCLKLIAIARQRAGVRWDIRRLAVLMLENQILRLRGDNLEEFDFIVTQLNLKHSSAGSQVLVSSLLKEGYSTTDLDRFIPEFRRKLERLNRVHSGIKGNKTSASSLRDFIELSRQHCKLTLGRYLFTPAEIVVEILAQLEVTEGLIDMDLSAPVFIADEIKNATKLLPDFEADILRRLCAHADIYWVSELTSSRINALVEYPTTTVVLVIKPPGSDLEIEIKRVGRPGRNSLNVVYQRNEYPVAPSHRLDGGCMQWLLRYEAQVAARFSLIYRLVHGAEAPIPNYVARSTIYSIPCAGEAVQTLDYFTEPELFGKGFRQMRTALKDSVKAFADEGTPTLPGIGGELGLTAQFIGQTGPAQAILTGTTSFRLDKLAKYLSAGGADLYFKDGLRFAYAKDDAQHFADSILEEVLGVYQPPREPYRSYEQYLDAAFRVDANRVRADQVYLSLMPQIATFWGTLLAVRGYTRGESFVGRNVGLKSCWRNGEWQVKIIFMDHDALAIPDVDEPVFYADSGIPNMAIDERYIWGRDEYQFSTSEVCYLQRIYQTGKNLDVAARASFEQSLQDAYRKTRAALLANQRLRSLFHKTFLGRLLDWDTVVGGYLQLNSHKSANAKWKKAMTTMLVAKGYKKGACDALVETIEKNRPFLERYAFLFDVSQNGK
jgi:hypothetical protein